MTEKRVYGRDKIDNPNGTPEDKSRCIIKIMGERCEASYQCSRKRGHGPDGLLCKQHAHKEAMWEERHRIASEGLDETIKGSNQIAQLKSDLAAARKRIEVLEGEKAKLLEVLKPFTELEKRNSKPIGRAYVGGIRQGMPSPESIQQAKAVYEKYITAKAALPISKDNPGIIGSQLLAEAELEAALPVVEPLEDDGVAADLTRDINEPHEKEF
ncbi:hypothetical protein KAR91_30530 [Candidatus Pacearchaeota archaeon]|nr:hypothetical protein [Candidatus Pacearchaeota archaeon]